MSSVAARRRIRCEASNTACGFPVESLRREHFRESRTRTSCGWKGQASYYDVIARGEVNRDAAWYYPHPKDAAREISGRVAFWHGVEIVEDR
jgi:uncharacterized protein (DUF427 family)